MFEDAMRSTRYQGSDAHLPDVGYHKCFHQFVENLFTSYLISWLGDRFQALTSPPVLCLALGASAEQAATEKITRASEQFEAQPGDSGGVCLSSDLIEFFRRKQNTVKTSNSACV